MSEVLQKCDVELYLANITINQNGNKINKKNFINN